jgi:hypothetical protein
MGMDVYGKNPTSEVGSYYRQSIWGWHPLWHYVETFHSNYGEQVEHGHTNDGDGLDAENSSQLALALKQDLLTGLAKQRLDEWEQEKNEQPDEVCGLCEGSGIRSDKIGVEHGMDKKELSAEQSSTYGRRIGWCNSCDGKGSKRPFETAYGIDLDDLREFADFLADCGGFEIC